MEIPKTLLETQVILDKMIKPKEIPKKSRVFVCGDIHGAGSNDIKKINSRNWEEQKKLTKNDFLIFLGDFGIPWGCGMKDGATSHEEWGDIIISKEDKYWTDWLVSRTYTSLVLLGNHEPIYSILKYIPKTYYEPIKGYVKELKLEHGLIRFLMKDSEYFINGKRFLVIGGALSIDKTSRIPEVSWWEEEMLTKNEQDNVLDVIEKDTKFDYVLSHTCPSWLVPQFTYGDNAKIYDPVAQFLEHVENRIEFDSWHFGHFHVDESYTDSLGSVFQCHYNSEPFELEF